MPEMIPQYEDPYLNANIGYCWAITSLRPQNLFLDTTPAVNQENHKIRWIRQDEDPSTQTDLVNNEEKQVYALILQLRKSRFISNKESLANQLRDLLNIVIEEESTSISVDSVRNFYRFLQLYNNIKSPILSLTPDYNIYASWREEAKIFSMHFLPNGEIRFVFFQPNNRHPEQKIRISGIATGDILTEIFASENLKDWILGEG
jgi:hypothetical protein